MERIKTRGEDGKQNSDYYKTYYIQNKERLAKKFKDNYQRIKADPVLLEEHRAKTLLATKQYRQRHPDRVKLKAKQHKQNYRLKVFNLLGGAVCVNCGCTELEFLELNHKNGGGSQQIKTFGNRLMRLIYNGLISTDGYDVRCRVCNALDYLKRKNPEKASYYQIDFTGKKAERQE